MAIYNSGYPMNYNYYQQPMMPQQMPQPMQQMQQPVQQTQQTQTQYPPVQSGFVRVRNENEARMFPVAPGCSVTFIDESAPFCYAKTVNASQLDRPIFEKYRLVKEDDAPVEGPQKPVEMKTPDLSKYAMKTDVDAFRADLDAFRADIEAFRSDLYGLAGKKKTTTKKEVAVDE